MSEWITDRVRRVATFQAAAWSVLLLLCVWGLSAAAGYVLERLGTPFEADAAYFATNSSAGKLPHEVVRVRGTQVEATGVEYVSVSKNYGVETGRSVTPYWVLLVGDRWLVVKAKEEPALTVTGELRPIAGELYQALLPLAEDQGFLNRFHPLYIDADRYSLGAWLLLGALLGGLAGFGWLVVRAARRVNNPSLHRAVQRASKWGPLADISKRVHADAEAATLRPSGYALGERYAVRDSPFAFDVHRWEALLWAHTGVVRRRIYFVIPAGSQWTAHLHFGSGSLKIHAGEADVQRIVEFAGARAPGAVIGYDNSVADAFQKGRAALAAKVSALRAAASSEQAPPPV